MPLRELDRDLYCIDHDFRMFGVRMGGRTTVVRLADGALALHSPGHLTDADAGAIDALGTVEALLAPNLSHHVHLATAHRRWPKAQLLGPTTLQAKRPDLRFDVVLDGAAPWHQLPPAFAGILEPAFVAGVPDLDEFAFHHTPSRTMILTDLAFNVRSPHHWWTRAFMWVNDATNCFGPPRAVKSMFRNRGLARSGIEAILAHDFDRVIVAHGEVLDRGGREALRAGYEWLLSERVARG